MQRDDERHSSGGNIFGLVHMHREITRVAAEIFNFIHSGEQCGCALRFFSGETGRKAQGAGQNNADR